MEYEKLRPYIKWGCYYALLLILYALQTTPRFLEIFGIRPVYVLAFAVAVSMFEDVLPSTIFCMVAGLLWDISSGKLLGFNAIILLGCGMMISLLCIFYLHSKITNALLFCTAVAVIEGLLDYLLYHAVWKQSHSYVILVYHILPTILYTILIMIPIYYFTRWVSYKFNPIIRV